MRVLVDQHHADLLYSLQLLFEDRLGFDLFVAKGHEWWDEGYWRFGEVWGDDRLAQQFLGLNDTYREVEPGIFLTFDPHHPERPVYCITLAEAAGLSWDVVLATVQDNQAGFARFAREHGAQYLYQVGNTRQEIDWSLDPLVLNAADVTLEGRGVSISQEFDAHSTFGFRRPGHQNRVASFVNLLPLIPEAWRPFEELAKLLPEYRFRSFGHDCPDGLLRPVGNLADEMGRTGWAFHDKVTGDGFGHVIHNWAAIGRPLIGHASYYRGQRAEVFWQDGVTCLDLDLHSFEEAARIIRDTTPEQHAAMCIAIRSEFDRAYQPKRDADLVAKALGL